MKDQDKAPASQESRDKGRPAPREGQDPAVPDIVSGHPPIIIPDGSRVAALGEDDALSVTRNDILVQFDGEGAHRHYKPEDPPSYMSNKLRLISFIEVSDGTTSHRCVNVPGNYRVVVTDKHRHNGNESAIIIDATSKTHIDIIFPDGEYERKHLAGKRKRLIGVLKKIKSMEVFDSTGEKSIHQCDLVGPGKDVTITIRD